MKRGSTAWLRYRMISGAIFSLLGVFIAVRLILAPGPVQSKILGLGFALAAIALGGARVLQYLQARSATRTGQER